MFRGWHRQEVPAWCFARDMLLSAGAVLRNSTTFSHSPQAHRAADHWRPLTATMCSASLLHLLPDLSRAAGISLPTLCRGQNMHRGTERPVPHCAISSMASLQDHSASALPCKCGPRYFWSWNIVHTSTLRRACKASSFLTNIRDRFSGSCKSFSCMGAHL